MSTVLEERPLAHAQPRSVWAWAAVLAGLAALYVPTYAALARGLWREDEYAHGPVILAVFAWLAWRRRAALLSAGTPPAPVAGAALLAGGLALYLLGCTQSLALFEVASHLPVIAGAILLVAGWGALRRMAFALAFLAFAIPLPGFVLDTVTAPLKSLVSASVEALLVALSYPVEREGVVLWVGDHSMLVADACSGLNSLMALLALGVLYGHLVKASAARNALLVIAMVPIAIAANILRVVALVLVTYHFGEPAVQGLLHTFAGMLVFVAAFAILLGFDAATRKPASPSALGEGRGEGGDTVSHRRSAAFAAIAATTMALTAAAAPLLKPQPDSRPAPDLETLIPAAFGEWRIDPDEVPVAPAPDVRAKLDRLYKQVVSRTYVNAGGERVMLTVAYGGDQSDALKAHRQENCYAAQGFEIRALAHGTLGTSGRAIPVTRMLAVRGERSEPVTYWFTMGERVVLGRAERLRVQLENGLAGRVPDGMLVRVSSLSQDAQRAFGAHEAFISAVMSAVPAGQVARFVGRAG